ncbi:MAG: rRNA maturation RNase YbeY [Candidatus Vogelbacteria bacterium]|nr:rRNA maturation RNase YbeY [Candidatus Vogelbacteria bacterium]
MLHIKKRTKSALPEIPFEKIKNFVLGQGYELSLVFVGDKVSKQLNDKFRRKNRPTNILSFPYSETDGEIFIDPNVVKRELKFERTTLRSYLTYIFIHGLCHLKGFDHGSKMDVEEEKVKKKFADIFV